MLRELITISFAGAALLGCADILGIQERKPLPNENRGGSAGAVAVGGSAPTGGGGASQGGAGGGGAQPTVVLELSWGEATGADYAAVTADTGIHEPDNQAALNYGLSPDLVADSEAGVAATPLLRFDLSALPPETEVLLAELRIHTDDCVPCGQQIPSTFGVHEVLEAWDEGGENGAPGAANWNERLLGQPWTAAGARAGSTAGEPFGTFMATEANTAYVVGLFPSVIEAWIASPADNFGMAILNAGTDGVAFCSSNHGTATCRPLLMLTVEVPASFQPP